ncbi:MAG: electron transfer flavoprotein subunit beta/FixA family protein [Dehalococcoidia bacterium]|nr:electron transfer flavoprotein subunit beta/FixA family protein [Dehalococcoidia bacterium]
MALTAGKDSNRATRGERVLNIVVAVKQVLDPEAPPSIFKIDPEAKRVIPVAGIPPVLNPYDENALEAALRIKDIHQSRITAISMGAKLAKAVLRKCLAAGADELIMLEDQAFGRLDSNTTAYILATAITKIGYDLILTGRQAADTDAGQVGSGIAEFLGIPAVTIARKVEVDNGKLRVERVVADGYQVVEAPLPSLVTVSHELGQLRTVALRELMAAQDKPVQVWGCQDIGIEALPVRRTSMINLYIPQRESKCEIINGTSEEEAATNLALRLQEARIL